MPLSLTDLLLSTRMDRYGLTDLRLAGNTELTLHCGTRSCAQLLLSGSCTLTVDGGGTIPMKPGDYVLLPHGVRHRLLCGSPGRLMSTNIRSLALEETVPMCTFGEGSQGARFLTAVFGSERIRLAPEDSIVPNLVVVDGSTSLLRATDGPQIAQLNRALANSGGGALAVSFMHMLFVQAMTETIGRSYPGGVDKHQLSPLSAAIRIAARRLDEPWPVERLARSVGMSRSVFSALFTAKIGEPPGHYLNRVKLVEAEHLLRLSDLPISEVARQCGYRSQAAFSRAFKKRYDTAPERFRGDARQNVDGPCCPQGFMPSKR